MKEDKYKIRDENIIETAERIIKEKGYYRFKISDISDDLDIAKGTIYNHYSSKEELLFKLIYPKLRNLKISLSEIVNMENTFEEKFRLFIKEAINSDYHQFVLASFPDMSVLFQNKNKDKMDAIQGEIIEEFISILRLGIKEGIVNEDISLDYLSHQILSSINPLLYSILVNETEKMTEEEFIEDVTNFLFNGLRRR